MSQPTVVRSLLEEETAKKERAYRALEQVLGYAEGMAKPPDVLVPSEVVAASLRDLVRDELARP